jgi:tRNA A37 threonylcarbamoyladenosine synthetase subunit TsaC/SUA5/YrdC
MCPVIHVILTTSLREINQQRTNTEDHIEKRFTKNVDKRRISTTSLSAIIELDHNKIFLSS